MLYDMYSVKTDAFDLEVIEINAKIHQGKK